MAIYQLKANYGSKSKGQSARVKFQYICRQGKYSDVDRDEYVSGKFGNMPAWVKNPIDYWQAADGHERSNGVLFQQLMIALPIELTLEQRAKLTESIVEEVTGEQKLPYTFAIHKGKGHNPHIHLMISGRMNDGITRTAETWFKRANTKLPENGGALKADMGNKKWLIKTRELVKNEINKHLAAAGCEAKVSCSSLIDQGITNRAPIHKDFNEIEMLKRTDKDPPQRNQRNRAKEFERLSKLPADLVIEYEAERKEIWYRGLHSFRAKNPKTMKEIEATPKPQRWEALVKYAKSMVSKAISDLEAFLKELEKEYELRLKAAGLEFSPHPLFQRFLEADEVALLEAEKQEMQQPAVEPEEKKSLDKKKSEGFEIGD